MVAKNSHSQFLRESIARQHVRSIKIPSHAELFSLTQNLSLSWSGRMDVNFVNTFIMESVQLLNNALLLFEDGYFDAAYYSLRAAIELSTAGIFLSDLSDDLNKENMKSWARQERFPMFGKMLGKLGDQGAIFEDMKGKMPSFLLKICNIKPKLNKMVHKQGYRTFHVVRNHSLHSLKYPTSEFIGDFEAHFREAVGIVAVMRLAVDPFPVLLADQELLYRFPDSLTEPYSDAILYDCIGETVLDEYMKTESFLGHKQWILERELMGEAAFNVESINYISTKDACELLEQLHLLSINSIFAVVATLGNNDILWVLAHGGLTSYTNDRAAFQPSSGKSSTVAQSRDCPSFNLSLKQDCFDLTNRKVTGKLEKSERTLFISSVSIGSSELGVVTAEPMSKEAQNQLVGLSQEMRLFVEELSAAQKGFETVYQLPSVTQAVKGYSKCDT